MIFPSYDIQWLSTIDNEVLRCQIGANFVKLFYLPAKKFGVSSYVVAKILLLDSGSNPNRTLLSNAFPYRRGNE